MKRYSTLKVDKANNEYSLFDDNGNVLLSGPLSKTTYMYERSTVFNAMALNGWSVEFPMDSGSWFMMSKEV